MPTTRTCPQCQQPLAADAPDGLCPQCLLQAAANPAPNVSGDGLLGEIIDIADPVEVAKKLPQFEILELLGRGGMGVVYRARQPQLDRLVALKILPPVDALSADFVARFTREARALAKLNHPNIVNVHDFGETGGLYYIVMEYVDGANLRQLLEARKLTSAEALAIVPKICDALQYAHEEGLVHRDIKPENLLIDKKGRVKIADFGLAKLLRREALDMTLTLSGTALGTLRYMAPEQMDKPETVDHRADLYSLGVVIYEMLTGETPVGRFELPSQKAQVDVRLDEIVLHALEREPARRYQHASEVRDDVENITSKPVASAAAPEASHSKLGRGQTEISDPWTFLKGAEGRTRLILAMILAIFLAPLVVVLANGDWKSPPHLLVGVGSSLFGMTLLLFAGICLEIVHEWRIRRSPVIWKMLRTVLLLVAAFCLFSFLSANATFSASDAPYTFTIGNPFPWFEIDKNKVEEGKLHSGFSILLLSWSWVIFAIGWLSLYAWNQSLKSRSAAGRDLSLARLEPVAPQQSSEPRLSPLALWGAIWAPLFFITTVLFFSVTVDTQPPGETPPGPAWWQWVPRFTLLPLGVLAPFGTTILGMVAIAQIKRSGGKLYGLGLAIADALLFPLLFLFVLVAFSIWLIHAYFTR